MNESAENTTGIDLRYSVDNSPPPLLSSMLAAQTVLLIVAGIVITPAIVLRGANMPVSMEAGVIFFASSDNQLSLRILAGIAEDIRHFQFHGLDFISLTLSNNLPSVQNRPLI